MTREFALVDEVVDIAGEHARARTKETGAIDVRFGGGTAARLDPTSARDRAWAEVLESLKETRQPAYVEIDPETHYIASLLLPQALAVTAIREVPGTADLEIDMEISQARHYLRREHPRFDELREVLERARRQKQTVLVTESLDGSAIVDVRPARITRPKKPASRSR